MSAIFVLDSRLREAFRREQCGWIFQLKNYLILNLHSQDNYKVTDCSASNRMSPFLP
jgi:hypothetical protein